MEVVTRKISGGYHHLFARGGTLVQHHALQGGALLASFPRYGFVPPAMAAEMEVV